ncbi:NUDIX hydrolase [Streptomyces sp. KAI-26]|uniref:NUDIX hydrolase n=1 Tax=Streptomyces sp. KAI-26 TaxID=1169747 RepID=UPI0015872DC0|nr:NUDIX hydrolase [Streptomyces sp. KAI-26]NUV86560.1 NUDIX hydrolase [Streptomyces sp. KAI-26]NUW21245.1 NUDIX hydrolase [Streptomyces roseoviolaceus]
MSVEDGQVIRELAHYLHVHPAEKMALMPLYDAARDHAQRRACTHADRCPAITAGPVVMNEVGHVLAFQHEGRHVLFEAEPEDEDSTLSGAALRLLEETVGVRDVWTEPGTEGPFLVDVTPSGLHGFGPRIRVGFRYLFRAHSDVIDIGRAGWVHPSKIGIAPVRDRVLSHTMSAR